MSFFDLMIKCGLDAPSIKLIEKAVRNVYDFRRIYPGQRYEVYAARGRQHREHAVLGRRHVVHRHQPQRRRHLGREEELRIQHPCSEPPPERSRTASTSPARSRASRPRSAISSRTSSRGTSTSHRHTARRLLQGHLRGTDPLRRDEEDRADRRRGVRHSGKKPLRLHVQERERQAGLLRRERKIAEETAPEGAAHLSRGSARTSATRRFHPVLHHYAPAPRDRLRGARRNARHGDRRRHRASRPAATARTASTSSSGTRTATRRTTCTSPASRRECVRARACGRERSSDTSA